MVKKSAKSGPAAGSHPAFPDNIKDSAQQIWLAGLAAFSKAQEEGGKVFETLVQEGAAIQRKTQAAAEERLTQASHKMSSLATDLSAKATDQWDKLETIFEDRVARALKRLGVPAAQDVAALAARLDELSKTVDQLASKPAARPTAKSRRVKAATTRGTPRKSA